MGLLSNLYKLFSGLTEFFKMFRDMFTMLPLVVQLLIYFGFGGVMLLCLLDMMRTR